MSVGEGWMPCGVCGDGLGFVRRCLFSSNGLVVRGRDLGSCSPFQAASGRTIANLRAAWRGPTMLPRAEKIRFASGNTLENDLQPDLVVKVRVVDRCVQCSARTVLVVDTARLRRCGDGWMAG